MTKIKAMLRRRWGLILAVAGIGVVVGLASSFFADAADITVWEARETLSLESAQNANQNLVNQDALRIGKLVTLDRAAEILGDGTTGKDLKTDVQSAGDSETSSIEVIAFGADAKTAEKRVAAIVDAFLELDAELTGRSIQPQVDQAKENVLAAQKAIEDFDASNAAQLQTLQPGDPRLIAIEQSRSQLQLQLQSLQADVERLENERKNATRYSSLGAEPAAISNNELVPLPSNPIARAVIFGGLALLLGTAVAALMERSGGRIDTRDELSAVTSLPIITEVALVESVTDDKGRVSLEGFASEPYRRVRSAIQYAAQRAKREGTEEIHTILFTSTYPAEGKSTAASLTALSMAEAGMETMVVSADFRKPTIEGLLGTPRQPSLQDLAYSDGTAVTIDDVVHPADQDHLWVAASGKPTRETVGPLRAARDVIAEAVRRGGMVVIDSPPVLAANDSVELVESADYVVLVVRSGLSTRRALADTIGLLEQHGSDILGIVFIGAPGAAEIAEYYHGYYNEVAVATEKTARHGEKFTANRTATMGQPGVPEANGSRAASDASVSGERGSAHSESDSRRTGAPVVPPRGEDDGGAMNGAGARTASQSRRVGLRSRSR